MFSYQGLCKTIEALFFNRDMIHAACSNSNHLRTRQKPDTDKGWRNQCRLTAAPLPIPSAFQSGHLGYQERRLLLILGLICLLGLPDKFMCLELDTGKSRLRELWHLSPLPRISPAFPTWQGIGPAPVLGTDVVAVVYLENLRAWVLGSPTLRTSPPVMFSACQENKGWDGIKAATPISPNSTRLGLGCQLSPRSRPFSGPFRPHHLHSIQRFAHQPHSWVGQAVNLNHDFSGANDLSA